MNVIFGNAGHAKEIHQLARVNNIIIDFFVSIDHVDEYINGIKVISEQDFFHLDPDRKSNIYLGIGSGGIRAKIYRTLIEQGFSDLNFPNLIHPSVAINATLDKITIGKGCVIANGCILTTEIRVGDFVHINLNTTISHESTIGSFTTISPGCCICGNVKLEEYVFLGAHSTVIERIEVCKNVIIGAGAVVIRNIKNQGTYCGIPASRIK